MEKENEYSQRQLGLMQEKLNIHSFASLKTKTDAINSMNDNNIKDKKNQILVKEIDGVHSAAFSTKNTIKTKNVTSRLRYLCFTSTFFKL